MKFADAKDIKRARELGNHSSSVNLSRTEIARGKSSAMAQAITDKRKILGRLEAIASEWTDREILICMHVCIVCISCIGCVGVWVYFVCVPCSNTKW